MGLHDGWQDTSSMRQNGDMDSEFETNSSIASRTYGLH
jgi:hypothetical protein